MLYPVKECGGGVNKDATPSELAPGQWSDCQNVRFRASFAHRRGGIKAVYSVPTVAPYFLAPFITSTTRYMMNAGLAKVYANEGTTQTEITRYTDGKVISSITRVGTTATLTTATAHGLSTGNSVTVYGATPSQYNGTYSITVTSATTFTYTMASDPGASATVISATGYEYRVTADFTGVINDKWTGGSFNGIMVFNNPVDGMYYWSGDTAIRMRRMPGWTSDMKCDAIFFYKNYIIALAPTINGTKYPQKFMWGSAAEPGALPASWTAAATNDAGDSPYPAETGGALIDGISYGDIGFAFDQDACYGIQHIGGNDVFRVYRLPGDDGLLARSCMAKTPKGIVYLSNGDVKLHNGSESVSIAEGRVKDWLVTSIGENAFRSFVLANAMYSEVWVCFPSAGNTTCNTAAVWNWESDTWGIFDLPSLTCGTSGLVISGLASSTWDSDSASWDSDASTWDETELSSNAQRLIVANASNIGLTDEATQDFGSSFTWFLERVGLSLDDEDSMKTISASRWNFKCLAGTAISIYHGTSKTADGTVTYATAQTYTQGTTNMVNRMTSTSGRFCAVKASGTADQPVSLRSYAIDASKGGRF